MVHLPFNPEIPVNKRTASGSRSHTSDQKTISVSEVAGLVRAVLSQSLPAKLCVIGEVSNFIDRSHWFFSLKDEEATLRCVCFASAAKRVKFPLKDGMEVLATGRIDYYDAQGSLQLYVERIDPVGAGTLELNFRALCNELSKLGYFDVERKKALPTMPQKVAVVTSRSGAALQDVINTAAQRWMGCRLLLFDVHVQGEVAAGEIAGAIKALSHQGKQLGIDAVILTRGGGSTEDLWVFNDRVVADALFQCRLPVVAAIGHETDTTIAELVADMRCATPTQAAMTLIPDRESMLHQVWQLGHRLTLLTGRKVESSRQRWDAAARHPAMKRPHRMLEPVRQRLDGLAKALVSDMAGMMQASCQRMAAIGRQLEAIGPRNVLQRGYSYTLGADGSVLRAPGQVKQGDRITTELADGRLTSVVDGDSGGVDCKQRRGPKHNASELTLFQ